MFACPNCDDTALVKGRTAAGLLWGCPDCDGRAITLSMLRRQAPVEYVGALWRQVRAASDGFRSPKDCPSCRRRMVEVASPAPVEGIELDVCDACHFVWFDPGELDSLPRPDAVAVEPEPELDPRVRQQVAIARAGQMRELAEEPLAPPGEWWQVVCSLLGMPVEERAERVTAWPLLTWSLGLAMVLVTVGGMVGGNLGELIRDFGLLPSDWGRHHGLTFLTSLVLHGGVVHLLGNLYFLLVFGDNSEEALGRGKYAALLLLAGLVGDLCHMVVDPRASTPLVGASGAISGILGYYAMRFPHVRIVYFLRFYYIFRFIRLNVRWALAIWIGLQLLGAWKQVAGFTNVSAIAHLGGVAVGLGFFWFDRWWSERGTVETYLENGRLVTRRRPGGPPGG